VDFLYPTTSHITHDTLGNVNLSVAALKELCDARSRSNYCMAVCATWCAGEAFDWTTN
jgi:hypothetical protein